MHSAPLLFMFGRESLCRLLISLEVRKSFPSSELLPVPQQRGRDMTCSLGTGGFSLLCLCCAGPQHVIMFPNPLANSAPGDQTSQLYSASTGDPYMKLLDRLHGVIYSERKKKRSFCLRDLSDPCWVEDQLKSLRDPYELY